MHAHGDGGLGVVLGLPFAIALIVYCSAVGAHRRRRSEPWPPLRTASWVAGIVVLLAVALGPLPRLAHDDYSAHVAAHLLVGMLAPLLLVFGAPVTLALRTLDVVPARRLARLLLSLPVRFVAHPVTAAVLNVGSLWVVSTTSIGDRMLQSPMLHTVLLVHFLLTGYLFTASIVGTDPAPHRPGFRTRAVVLVLAVAAHTALARTMYLMPPPGVPADEARAGAVLMLYGGDAVELALIAVFCVQWARSSGRRPVTARVASADPR